MHLGGVCVCVGGGGQLHVNPYKSRTLNALEFASLAATCLFLQVCARMRMCISVCGSHGDMHCRMRRTWRYARAYACGHVRVSSTPRAFVGMHSRIFDVRARTNECAAGHAIRAWLLPRTRRPGGRGRRGRFRRHRLRRDRRVHRDIRGARARRHGCAPRAAGAGVLDCVRASLVCTLLLDPSCAAGQRRGFGAIRALSVCACL